MTYRFFETSFWAERRLIPESDSWWEKELAEKRDILKQFWDNNITKKNLKVVEAFKNFIIAIHFPPDRAWQEKIESTFFNAIKNRDNFDDFFDALKYNSLRSIKAIGYFDTSIKTEVHEMNEQKVEFTARDFINIKRYMVEKNLSSSISFGYADSKLITPNFSEKQSSVFSMHSVGKVFTGMLAMIMIRNNIISDEDLNIPPVKLDPLVLNALPLNVREQLRSVSLHQLMTHQAGLGDYNDKYFQAISEQRVPKIKQIEDFLPFADEKTYPIGEEKYSNLGILLVGLAIKHAYEKKYGPKDYNTILQEQLIDKIDMPSFSPWAPKNAQFNKEDHEAPHIVGSPAGCYWTTAEDLGKFGQWVYKQCKTDPGLEPLMNKYGQEFYNPETRIISHGGNIASASAFLSVSLKTGAIVATLSDQPDMAYDLESRVQTNIFSKPLELDEDLEYHARHV